MRPKTLDEFIGQQNVVTKLKAAIDGSNSRDEALSHVLFYSGIGGVGKNCLAEIIAHEKETELHSYVASSFQQPKDLASAFLNIKPGSIVFLDEIHALPKKMQESIYSVMEDFKITIQAGPNKVVTIPVKPFTLIGATTDVGKLTQPLKTRFPIHCHLEEYNQEDMEKILEFHAESLDVSIDKAALSSLAKLSRGIPRVGRNLISSCRDLDPSISIKTVEKMKQLEGIGPFDLKKGEINYLCNFYKHFTVGPTGVNSILSTMGVDKDWLNEIETHLIKEGFVIRSPRGRILESKSVKLVQELMKEE